MLTCACVHDDNHDRLFYAWEALVPKVPMTSLVLNMSAARNLASESSPFDEVTSPVSPYCGQNRGVLSCRLGVDARNLGGAQVLRHASSRHGACLPFFAASSICCLQAQRSSWPV